MTRRTRVAALNAAPKCRFLAIVGAAIFWLICLGAMNQVFGATTVRLSGTMRADGDVEYSSALTRPQISDAAQRAVFVAKRDGPAGQSQELWSVPLSGGEPTRLNAALDFAHPDIRSFAITPDGLTVLYTGYSSAYSNRLHLWSVPITGPTAAAPVTLLSGSGMIAGGTVSMFRISPDSNRVVFRANANTTTVAELFSVPLAPSVAAPTPTLLSGTIVAGGSVDSNLPFVITANSATVVFLANRVNSNTHDLWSVPITGPTGAAPITNLSQIQVLGGNLNQFDLSTDGLRAVFIGDRVAANRIELWSAPLAPSTTTPIVTNLSGTFASNAQRVTKFAISPVAPFPVVFLGDVETTGVDELFRAPIDGSSAHAKISATTMIAGGDVYDFSISPDGVRVAFTADAEVNNQYELWSVATGGGSVAKISGTMVSGGFIQNADDFAFIANSQRVVFIANRVTAADKELWSSDAVTGNPARLSTLSPGVDVSWFALLPGGRIVYAILASPGYRLLLTSLQGGGAAFIATTRSPTSVSTGASAITWVNNPNDVQVDELFGMSYLSLTLALDLDADGKMFASTDGLIASRWMQYLPNIGQSATSPLGLRTSAAALAPYMRRLGTTPAPDFQVSRVSTHTPIGNDAKLSPVARITPDGARVIVVDDHDNPGQDQVWSYSTGSAAPVKLSNNTTSDPITAIELSATGNRVVYLQGSTLWSAPVATAGAALNISDTIIDVTTFKVHPTNNLVLHNGRSAIGEPINVWQSLLTGVSHVSVSGMTSGARAAVEYAYAPDASYVVYRADADTVGQNELYRYTISPPARFKLSTTLQANGNVTDFEISPNVANANVVYRADYTVDNRFELLSVPASGGPSILVSGSPVTGRDASRPKFSLNGNRIFFRSNRDDANKTELFRVQVDGSSLTKIGDITATSGSVNPNYEITPDGVRIVFIADRATTGVKELYSVVINTGVISKLSFGSSESTTKFAISPDGTNVVFLIGSLAVGTNMLSSVPIAGGVSSWPRLSPEMTGAASSIIDFAISPDSQRVVFRGDAEIEGQIELWSTPIAGVRPVRLSGSMVTGGNVSYFVNSPVGDQVVFRADRESPGVHELWRTPSTGGGPALDIDGNGELDAATDGLLISRWLLGFRGNALIASAVATIGATRNTAPLIEAYLRELTSVVSP
jgi:hypothetical protein